MNKIKGVNLENAFSTEKWGGGLSADKCNVDIYSSTIKNSTAPMGGAIYSKKGDIKLTDTNNRPDN